MIYPGQGRGALEWFRRELGRRGLKVSATTMHRWGHDGIPAEHRLRVEEVLEELADIAQRRVDTLQRKIREAR